MATLEQKLIRINSIDEPLFIVVDLFCGAGGTTTGFDMAVLPKRMLSDYGVGTDFQENGFRQISKVIACVNHDPKAIKSHWSNHPEVKHFEEDIRTLDLTALKKLVAYYRKKYPKAMLVLWASLECTNFSKAKGGQPRDADSRTLADHLERYVTALQPDYIQIENVVEFMSWGPLDENGKPISRRNGEDFMRWRKMICEHGYRDDWKELNSANFGAYTSRNRLFGIFAKEGLPIMWPAATHVKLKAANADLFNAALQPWKAVRDVLDFADEGESIFNRVKPLSDKTLERILAGLIKYVANGDKAFISKYFSGKPKGKVNSVQGPASTVTTVGNLSLVQAKNFSDLSVHGPAGTITTIDHHALVQTSFIQHRNSGDPDSKIVSVDGPARTITSTGGNQDLVQAKFMLQAYVANSKGSNVFSIDGPGRTITTRDVTNLVSANFLTHYYGNGGEHSPVYVPAPTIPCKARTALIKASFLTIYNGKSLFRGVDHPAPVIACNDRFCLVQPYAQNQSMEQPAGSILTNDKHRLVCTVPFLMPTNFDNMPVSLDGPAPVITANRKHHYLVNPSHGGWATSTSQPCPVIIARQDKAPLYLIQAVQGAYLIPVYEGDSEVMYRIKKFMAMFRIVDIRMRMLRVHELLKIQGFPSDYKLEGNQADQKKFIGNSVVPQVVKAWTEAMGAALIPFLNQRRVA